MPNSLRRSRCVCTAHSASASRCVSGDARIFLSTATMPSRTAPISVTGSSQGSSMNSWRATFPSSTSAMRLAMRLLRSLSSVSRSERPSSLTIEFRPRSTSGDSTVNRNVAGSSSARGASDFSQITAVLDWAGKTSHRILHPLYTREGKTPLASAGRRLPDSDGIRAPNESVDPPRFPCRKRICPEPAPVGHAGPCRATRFCTVA